jgi:hypothetical protein
MSLAWHLIIARSGHKERSRSHLSALQNPLLSPSLPRSLLSLSPAAFSLSLSRVFLLRTKTFGPPTRFPVSSLTVFCPARSHRRTEDTDHCNFVLIFLQETALLLLFVSTSFSAFLSPAISAIRVSPGSKSEDLGVTGPCFGVLFSFVFSMCVCVCVRACCVYMCFFVSYE